VKRETPLELRLCNGAAGNGVLFRGDDRGRLLSNQAGARGSEMALKQTLGKATRSATTTGAWQKSRTPLELTTSSAKKPLPQLHQPRNARHLWDARRLAERSQFVLEAGSTGGGQRIRSPCPWRQTGWITNAILGGDWKADRPWSVWIFGFENSDKTNKNKSKAYGRTSPEVGAERTLGEGSKDERFNRQPQSIQESLSKEY